MKTIDFHPIAAREARKGALRYSSVDARLGLSFQTQLAAIILRIQTNPLWYAADADGIRRAPLKRFPYAVIYEELPHRLWIAAVAHHKRRSRYWARRKPN